MQYIYSVYIDILCSHGIKVLKRNLSEIEEEGELGPDRTLKM